MEQQSQQIFRVAELLLLVCYTTELPKFQTAAFCVNYTVWYSTYHIRSRKEGKLDWSYLLRELPSKTLLKERQREG